MGLFRRRKKEAGPSCSAVVVAAGSSTRMGFDKVLADLDGTPVIVRCLQSFQQAPSVAEVVVVTRTQLVPEVARLCQDYGLSKVSKVIRGGDSRTRSARMGTLECSPKAKLIAIHDGAALTDDCAAVERLGMRVSLTPGDERNIKLTTPADLLVGQLLAEEMAEP